jgi:tetratricopeptide (TPR) repeat protein
MISSTIRVKFRVVMDLGYFCNRIIGFNFSKMDRITKLKAFIDQYPADMFSRHALAMEFIKLQRYPEALEAMIALLAADENHSGTYYHLGKLYEQLGDHENAMKIYEKGINIAGKVNAENDLRELKGALSQLKDELDQ